MTKLELASQLVQQLQQQNSSNLDMIDKLQQQVQVQQTWFQWAVGIFISIAIAIGGLTWLSIRSERKRSREEIVNLKNQLGIDELSELVESQKETLSAMKKESEQYKKETKVAKQLVDSLHDQLLMQNEIQLNSAGIELQLVAPQSESALLKSIANLELVLLLPEIDKVSRADLVGFAHNLTEFWSVFKTNNEEFRKEYISIVVEMLNRTKDLVLKKIEINGQLQKKYIEMLNEATRMERELK